MRNLNYAKKWQVVIFISHRKDEQSKDNFFSGTELMMSSRALHEWQTDGNLGKSTAGSARPATNL
jgi:hypothetical protein